MSEMYNHFLDAGISLAVLREYQQLPLDHPDKPVFAAALASLTAESMGGTLHTFNEDGCTQFTLLVSEWTESSSPSAVLIRQSIPCWSAAVSYWCMSKENLFRNMENVALDNFGNFIMESTYKLWHCTPKGSPVRWAEAARLFDESGLAKQEGFWKDDAEHENWNNGLVELKPKLLDVLGYESIEEIGIECLDEHFPTALLQEVLINESNSKNNLKKLAFTCVAKPLPTHIPIEVLKNRGELSLAQALAFYLVDEEYGPKLTYATAATMLGMKNRQEIGTHLKRARDTFRSRDKNHN
jgi:hypothetical protein